MQSSVDTATPHSGASARPQSIWRATSAALIGNTLEWYDMALYAYFAYTISRLFFPTDDASLSLLITFGTFGVSFLIRPLGAIVLGAYADRAGRKKSLTLSISLMMAGTFIIACLPTFETIGILAPIGILTARLLQGFSAGGEFGSSTAYLIEHASERQRGFIASLQFASQGLGTVLASLFGLVLTSTLSDEDLLAWGWRIPFIFGLLIGPVGFYIRKHCDESPAFQQAEPSRRPVRDLFSGQKLLVLIAMGTLIVSTASNFLIQYMPSYAANDLGMPQASGFMATLIGGLILTFVTPFVGMLSDRVGRVRIMIAAALVYLCVAYPAFVWLNAAPTQTSLILIVCLMALIKAIYFAPLPALMAETFPVQTRAIGMSLSYNIGVTLFGGFAPFIAASLITLSGDKTAPSYYLMFAALLSLCALLGARFKLNLR
ncbi:MFS transporter [Metapseudomonas resinovorans]|uniref:Putative major facilitator superfamily transporter n=1 Tax=Metapseudomonas resinovorans NBRC 106553 TaxID=1245471 RepID=S6ADF9_METRE|nr:MFS transporter [Pseudomonas resinovorans]BAN47242.1 putative major facilitator superfamily transporter [Pseudomonas resinovorans NBRC 106553]